MRRSVRGGVVLTLVLALLAAGASTAGAQVAPNQIVIHAVFGNGEPPADASLTAHVLCANEGGSPVVTVVDQTVTLAAPWDPVAVDIPVLEAGGSNTFVGCEVSGQWTNVSGFPELFCAVTDPGTPPPSPSPPSGCGPLRSRVDAFFPMTVSSAVYDVTMRLLLPPSNPAPVPDAVAAAPTFTG